MKTITVGITVKNSKATIKSCIDSVLKQNYPKGKYKIYVVDAFSTDGTYEILKKYGKKIILEQKRGNIASGHNHIIKNSFTELIALTDADCVVDKNWLRELEKCFYSKKRISATAGICLTPKTKNKLQKFIGKELDERFRSFPPTISRAPTMNLMIRTDVAKKYIFDETFSVAQETDFGYRLTKDGHVITFCKDAIVYHYHRATWKSFFKQQFRYGTMMPKLYFRHKDKIKGDHISKPSMALHLVTFYFGALSLIMILFSNAYLIFFGFFVLMFLLISIYEFTKLKTRKEDFPYFLLIFFVRTLAWSVGLIFGIVNRA